MSKIIGRPLYAPAPAGGGKPSAPKFTYDGDYVIRDDGVVELLTSGTLVFLNPAVIDIFCVGGGGAGGVGSYYNDILGGGGGAGGYTRTILRQAVSGNINVTIGAGAASNAKNGGMTSFGSILSANGGNSAVSSGKGGNGGSGGGGGVSNDPNYGKGGSDGSAGENGLPSSSKGGTGQGNTTREFGESTGKLYAGGGGGGRYLYGRIVVSMGGAGGGGNGAADAYQKKQPAAAGVANTGGGGGGGTSYTGRDQPGAAGGSGIVCFRAAHELPELAGTWVLNERLYAPESNTAYNGSATITNTSNKSNNVTYVGATTAVYSATLTNGNNFTLYNFATNKWDTSLGKNTKVTFPTGASAPEEFRAWLASNATKQTA